MKYFDKRATDVKSEKDTIIIPFFWHNVWWFNSWHLSFYPEFGTKEAAYNVGMLQCCSNPILLHFYMQHIKALFVSSLSNMHLPIQHIQPESTVKDGCNMFKDFFARLDSMISKITSSTPRQSRLPLYWGLIVGQRKKEMWTVETSKTCELHSYVFLCKKALQFKTLPSMIGLMFNVRCMWLHWHHHTMLTKHMNWLSL